MTNQFHTTFAFAQGQLTNLEGGGGGGEEFNRICVSVERVYCVCMKQISYEEENPFTLSLNICPRASKKGVARVTPPPITLTLILIPS
jgi:hypothetical protein